MRSVAEELIYQALKTGFESDIGKRQHRNPSRSRADVISELIESVEGDPRSLEILEELLVEDARQVQHTQAVTLPSIRADLKAKPWYRGPDANALSWQRYARRLKASPGMSRAFPVIDAESTTIVDLLANPMLRGESRMKKKGLVLGYVQSGKTANYAAVISKAVGAGYRFVIVLAGMHTSLQIQTQQRLERDLTFHETAVASGGEPVSWYKLTHSPSEDTGWKDIDIQRYPMDEANSIFEASKGQVIVAVVKKNASRLENLYRLFDYASEESVRNCPVLIIDDESDQASPNTQDPELDPSTINRLLRKIWGKVQTGTYVAYTATPYANLLMDPNDPEELYPSDFIFPMQEPDGYLGSRAYFGTETTPPVHEALRKIPAEDSERISPRGRANKGALPEMVPSLERAVCWYLISTAIRRLRGHEGASSMLIHLSIRVEHHNVVADEVSRFLDSLRAECMEDADAFSVRMQKVLSEVSGNPGSLPVWAEIELDLNSTLDTTRIVVDNSASEARLNYPDEPRFNVIVVGGNTLSRGLTIEHLVCSYFGRNSRTYDTLLQMGRWFGFRPGYEDLVKVWVAPGLTEDYSFLADTELDIREMIDQLMAEKRVPQDVGIKIRKHPGHLNVTTANKMRHASEVQVALQGERLQTHLFSIDRKIIEHNTQTMSSLLKSLNESGYRARTDAMRTTDHKVFEDIPVRLIQPFFRDFHVVDNLRSLKPDITNQWLDEFGKDTLWNVVVVSPKDGQPESLPDGFALKLTSRSRLGEVSAKNEVSIKALIAPSELIIDLPAGAPVKGKKLSEILAERRARTRNAGLLLLYLINKDSKASEKQKVADTPRNDLGAPEHVPAFGVVFPKLDSETEDIGYISVQIDNPGDVHIDPEDES